MKTLFVLLKLETGPSSLTFLNYLPVPLGWETQLATLRGKKNKCLKGEEVVKKLPLGQALSIHVLHPVCAKGIGGGAKSKAVADEELHLLWSPYLPLQPTLMLASTL